MKKTFDRLCRGLSKVDNEIEKDNCKYMWSNRLGYISTCPSDLGTGLRAGKFSIILTFMPYLLLLLDRK